MEESVMEPNFTLLLICTILFSVLVLYFISWRYGISNAITFLLVSGLFAAIMDFISSFVVNNYVYPGKSQIWVFSFIFFGWTSVCGSSIFLAEGILAKKGYDLLTQKDLWWKVPLLTAVVAVVLDLFVDPVAVDTGYWVWAVKGTVYYEIPLLNFVGWFVLMLLAPMAWILVLRIKRIKPGLKPLIALGMIIPLMIASIVLSILLNTLTSSLGLQ